MGDNLGPKGLSRGCRVFCSRSKYPRSVVHEADEPNALVDFLDSEPLTGQDGRYVYPLAVQTEASAGGYENVAVVERICELGQAVIAAR
jgi:hypothetical protein